jgi:DNA-binding response OmpR family regulator
MRRILVVDDEPQIFPAIGTWPRQPGFRVSLADGGINRPATFEQATLLNVIGDGLSEAAARRRQVVGAAANARSKSAEAAMGEACRG